MINMFNKKSNLENLKKGWLETPLPLTKNNLITPEKFEVYADRFIIPSRYCGYVFNFFDAVFTHKLIQTPDFPLMPDKEGLTIQDFSNTLHPEDQFRLIQIEKTIIEFWTKNIAIEDFHFYKAQYGLRAKINGNYEPILLQSIILDVDEEGKGIRNNLVFFSEFPFDDRDYIDVLDGISCNPELPSYYGIKSDNLDEVKQIIKPKLDLSARELEILTLISYGKSSKDIAEILSISKNTVDNHRKHMLERNAAGSITELVRIAIKHDKI